MFKRFLGLIAPLVVLAAPVIVWLAKFSPYFHIKNKDGSLYMERYWVIFPRWWLGDFGVRVHVIRSSDDDRALHDHPWPFWSIILDTGYREVFRAFDDAGYAWAELFDNPNKYPEECLVKYEWQTRKWVICRDMERGAVNKADSTTYHRLRLFATHSEEAPATTLFMTGPYEQGWGFMVGDKKVPHRVYTAQHAGAARVQENEAELTKAFGKARR